MPRNDVDQYGRFKDSVAMIAEAIDIHMSSLDHTWSYIHRSDVLMGYLMQNIELLREFESRYNAQRKLNTEIFNDLVKDIEEFSYTGITDRQEYNLQRIIAAAVKRSQSLDGQALETDAMMKALNEGLASLGEDVARLPVAETPPAAAAGGSVELF